MDRTGSGRRQPGAQTPGKGVSSAVMEPPDDTAGMGAPSTTDKMPGEGMTGAAMGAASAREKMPGEGMTGTAVGAASVTDKMPGEGMPGTAMGAASATDKMPGAGVPGAAMGATAATGKMPGVGMQAAAPVASSGKMPGRGMAGVLKAEEPFHVLVKPGESLEADAVAGLGPYTKRGSTANFDIYYDNSLGTNGQHLADAVLANCEWDLFELRGWFGGVAAGRFRFLGRRS